VTGPGPLDWPPIALQFDPLQGIDVKLAWAGKHIDELEKEIAYHMRGKGAYRIAHERQADGWFLGTFQLRHDPPIIPSIIFGEAIGQMRSSLDHLMVLMIRTNDPEGESENFPICEKPADFFDARGKSTPSWADTLRRTLRPEHFELVKSVQPFKTKSATLPTIRRLNNLDKHELIHALYAGPRHISVPTDPNVAELDWLIDPTQRLYDRTQLYRVRYVDSTQVQVPMRVVIDVVIGPIDTYVRVDTLRTWLVQLQDIVQRVRDITPEFSRTS